MATRFQEFLDLHHQATPLMLGNVWSVPSAKAYEKCGYKAIGTSSAALAQTLGYEDGEEIPFDEYLFMVERIAKSTSLPLSVDMEAGFGNDAEQIAKNIIRLVGVGVVGINLEDSRMKDGKRALQDKTFFRDLLKSICDRLRSTSTNAFINVRCDPFLIGHEAPVQEAIARIRLYNDTGVHGIFLPCIVKVEDIKAVVAESRLPINVMCMPDLPDFATLASLGVKRISSGNFIHSKVYADMEVLLKSIESEGGFKPLF
ncbi:MAG: isocitrate lyase/phosphoenolpyruvate mutase family protein [Cyclobacteriaceae bacterium]|nr:isocitrate lyase/phosphoenolpyruvate mutase family protein [Cyclobacteriaceae bacterium]